MKHLCDKKSIFASDEVDSLQFDGGTGGGNGFDEEGIAAEERSDFLVNGLITSGVAPKDGVFVEGGDFVGFVVFFAQGRQVVGRFGEGNAQGDF